MQEVRSYLCPADPEVLRKPQQGRLPAGIPPPGDGMGRNNYVGNIGNTPDMRSTDGSRVGIFNYQLGPGNTLQGFPVVSRVRIPVTSSA